MMKHKRYPFMIWMDGKLKVLDHFYGKYYFRECDKNGYPIKKKPNIREQSNINLKLIK